MHMYNNSSSTHLSISARAAVPSPFDRVPSRQFSQHQERLVEFPQRRLLAPTDKMCAVDFRDACGGAHLPKVRTLAGDSETTAGQPHAYVNLHKALRNKCRSRFVACPC